MRSLANFILFQLGWCLAVLFPGSFAAFAALAIVVAHLAFISAFPLRELRFIIMVTVLGSTLDVIHLLTGVLAFPDHAGALAGGMIPLWLVMLWAVFATAINHCLYWMRRSSMILFGLPPIAGALAYYSAGRLGSIEIGYGLAGIAAIGAGWGLLYPVLVRISIWLEGNGEETLVQQRW